MIGTGENDYQLFNSTSLIIDMGSGYIKAGVSGENKPTCVFQSLIGHPKYNSILPNQQDQHVVGPSPESRGLYRLERPIKRGVIESISDTRLILQKIQRDLNLITNKDNPVFIATPPFTSLKQKENIAQELFSNFDVPSIFFGTQGVLSLYGAGRIHGVVLESGEGVTQVVPVYDGYKLDYAVERIDMGGQDVTEHLRQLLRQRGINLKTSSEQCIIQEMKESVCQIAETQPELIEKKAKKSINDQQEKKLNQVQYELPDGQIVSFEKERYLAPEILFNPSLVGIEYSGLHHLLNSSIKKLDMDLKRNLYKSIVLSGGNTQINGFAERLASEMENLVGKKTIVEITASNENRGYLPWIGASSISAKNTFSKLWITKKEYKEHGESIFLKKQF